MDLNIFGGKQIPIKEALEFMEKEFGDLKLGIYKNSLKQGDFLTLKKNIDHQHIIQLNTMLVNHLSEPDNPKIQGVLLGLVGKLLDPKAHTLLYNGKAIKLNFWTLYFKLDLPVRFIAGAVLGFFYKEIGWTTSDPK